MTQKKLLSRKGTKAHNNLCYTTQYCIPSYTLPVTGNSVGSYSEVL